MPSMKASSRGGCRIATTWLRVFALATCLLSAQAMECYVCNNQEGNDDKCIKTSRQCQQHENACYSLIEYRLPTQYWQQNGDRSHFLTKNCTSLEKCRSDSDNMAIQCNREWYNDWRCLECCSGELCNFYATLDGYRMSPGLRTVSLLSAGSLWLLFTFSM
ncbi:hypothetical protein BOX15_Mlig001866g2 [Macrostomum lignano]|uniref:UPAR/Ly6 domain-containing protein n=2 Tax=Macrostomum lignano TaxID=282301 RepID=A0A267H2E4_9PLAT|nr:hypothetical protein BOX15_Mlig001866g2 [Macrostomum lignano]